MPRPRGPADRAAFPAAVVLVFLIGGAAALRAGLSPEAPAPPDTIVTLIMKNRGAEAEPIARKRLLDAERDEGPDSLRAAEAIDDLMMVTAATKNRETLPMVRRLAERSLTIKRKLLGENHPGVADTLNGFADMLWSFEEFRAALPLAESALAIRRKALGPRHLDTARSLYQMGELHRMLGDYSGARSFLEQALAVWLKIPGSSPLSIAASLHYLGIMRWTTGDYEGARTLMTRALVIRERAAGLSSAVVAFSCNSLGNLAFQMGDPFAAMSLFKRAQAIWETSFGPASAGVARSLESQGHLFRERGDRAAARRLFERALEIRKAVFGPAHYLVARGHADLARLAASAGDHDEAGRLFRKALEIQQMDPQQRGPELTSTLIDYARLAWASGDRATALERSLTAEAGARAWFQRTSRGLAEQDALRYESVLSTGLDLAFSILAPETGPGLSPAQPGAAARVWDEKVRSRAMLLDEAASRHRAATSTPRPGLEEVSAHLPTDAAMIGYVRYAGLTGDGAESGGRYLAMVMTAGNRAPVVVPLGGAETIDALVHGWRVEAGADPRVDPDHHAERRYLDAARRLREAIWDPLEPALERKRYVFVVPDGAIGLVSLASLPRDDGTYLIESGPRIHYLSAERDLVVRHAPSSSSAGMLVLGGADFDVAPAAGTDDHVEATPACRVFETMRFEPLPGSLREADEVEALWRAKLTVLKLTGTEATESAFKAGAPGQRILHLATHGYFLNDRCVAAQKANLLDTDGVPVGDNPLLLSGLALAGANRRVGAGHETDDGLLTAPEIGALDLSGVDWAVLSGCETGVGQVLQGEGVLGLRRAFQVAGAGTLIMSLLQVDDGAARIWMRHLYEGRLAGLPTVEAVSRASLQILEEQRRRGGTTHPYFWGSFVAAGDWR